MEIRKLIIDDYDAVYALWSATPGVGLNDIDDSRAGIEKYLKRNPETSFAALENGKLVGVIMCGHDGRRGFIYHMTVAVEARGRGIGTALLSAAENALRAEGIIKAALVVFCDNEVGNNFWERRGYTTRPDLHYRNRSLI